MRGPARRRDSLVPTALAAAGRPHPPSSLIDRLSTELLGQWVRDDMVVVQPSESRRAPSLRTAWIFHANSSAEPAFARTFRERRECPGDNVEGAHRRPVRRPQRVGCRCQEEFGLGLAKKGKVQGPVIVAEREMR